MTFSTTKFALIFTLIVSITLLSQLKSTNKAKKPLSSEFKPSKYLKYSVETIFKTFDDKENRTHQDTEYCHVYEANSTDYCSYVQENDECNKYLKLNFCVLESVYLKPLFYIIMVKSFMIIILLGFYHLSFLLPPWRHNRTLFCSSFGDHVKIFETFSKCCRSHIISFG
jgi:hypothetical protein